MKQYRRLHGKLIYLTITWPDISYSVGIMSQFIENPTKTHMNGLIRIVKYLKNNIGNGLFFNIEMSKCLKVYSDSDYAGCPSLGDQSLDIAYSMEIPLLAGNRRNNRL